MYMRWIQREQKSKLRVEVPEGEVGAKQDVFTEGMVVPTAKRGSRRGEKGP